MGYIPGWDLVFRTSGLLPNPHPRRVSSVRKKHCFRRRCKCTGCHLSILKSRFITTAGILAFQEDDLHSSVIGFLTYVVYNLNFFKWASLINLLPTNQALAYLHLFPFYLMLQRSFNRQLNILVSFIVSCSYWLRLFKENPSNHEHVKGQ